MNIQEGRDTEEEDMSNITTLCGAAIGLDVHCKQCSLQKYARVIEFKFSGSYLGRFPIIMSPLNPLTIIVCSDKEID